MRRSDNSSPADMSSTGDASILGSTTDTSTVPCADLCCFPLNWLLSELISSFCFLFIPFARFSLFFTIVFIFLILLVPSTYLWILFLELTVSFQKETWAYLSDYVYCTYYIISEKDSNKLHVDLYTTTNFTWSNILGGFVYQLIFNEFNVNFTATSDSSQSAHQTACIPHKIILNRV